MNDQCYFNYIVDNGERSYYHKLQVKTEEFGNFFRITCSKSCSENKLWSIIRHKSGKHYNSLQLYKLQLYLPESIWELNKHV